MKHWKAAGRRLALYLDDLLLLAGGGVALMLRRRRLTGSEAG